MGKGVFLKENMEAKIKKNFEKFLEKYSLSKLKRNELLRQPGDALESVYYLKSGYLRFYTICKSGQEVTIYILKPHLLSPLFLSMGKMKSKYYIEAMTTGEAWQVPLKEMIDFITENPEILPEVMSKIGLPFKELLTRIEYLASGNAYTKVASVLLSLIDESTSKKTTEATLDLPATHRVIASLTGLTRETVTLQMLKLKKRGFISGKGRRLVIKNLAKLREEAACTAEEN